MKRHLLVLLVGAALGALLGWFTPELQHLPNVRPEVRQILAIKTGLVIGSLAYLVSMYLVMRRRVISRLTQRD